MDGNPSKKMKKSMLEDLIFWFNIIGLRTIKGEGGGGVLHGKAWVNTFFVTTVSLSPTHISKHVGEVSLVI
jgi:hypothetical protein